MADRDDKWEEHLSEFLSHLGSGKIPTLQPLLPILLNLKGQPYTIKDHFPFEPFFKTEFPRHLLLKTARQVSKSTSLAAQGTVQSNCIGQFGTLYVTPLYEMIRRFSTNYVRPFIEESPVKKLWVDTSSSHNVLQRSFRNKSKMYFSFAFLDADRTRGLPADKVGYDEVQDLDRAFIPIIEETKSASKWNISQYAGTPKTLDNTIEQLWLDSSQAEWVIQCKACNKWNIPALDQDLLKMVGPDVVKREISEDYPGVVCARCGRPVYPRTGHWVHANPELKNTFAGYHVPQIIMPMHYADPDKWNILLGKRRGFGNTPINVFYNEALGESYDTGAKLITITDLKKAATLHENNYAAAKKLVDSDAYVARILGVDWGGGGEKGDSFTTAAVCGLLPDGTVHVIYGWRSLTPNLHNEEARYILHLMQAFRCTHLAHDFGGAGAIRETLLVNAGWPVERILPIAYVRASIGPIMRWVEENPNTLQRAHYRVDKARSLVQLCDLIKLQQIRLFKYDYKGQGQAGLLHDFLSLVEDQVDSRQGSNVYTVIRNAQIGPDDFAHAVNYGVCALYYQRKRWPNVAELAAIQASREALEAMHPTESNLDWEKPGPSPHG